MGSDRRVSNVIIWRGVTSLDLPPDRILESAIGKLTGVMVIGYEKDGSLWAASSYADGGDALWLLESAKQALMRCGGLVVPLPEE